MTTILRIAGRPFEVDVKELNNSKGYMCYFNEKNETFGLLWGYEPSNKNNSWNVREDVYDWFKGMVEKNTPADESGEQVLEEVVNQLEEEFDQVERDEQT
jgi:hypothetical protein